MIKEALDKNGIRYRQHGQEAIIETCLLCGRKKHMYLNLNTGAWKCHGCGESGGIRKISELIGSESIVKPDRAEYKEREIRKPDQGTVEWYHSKLLDSPRMMDLLVKRKGINKESIVRHKLGLSKYDEIVIPHFEDGKVVNFKYFNYNGPEKKVRRFYGGKSVLYNIDCIDDNTRVCALCEGEWDAITLIQMGGVKVIANALGAGNWKDEWTNQLSNVAKIFVLYDNDEAGISGAEKVVKILGPSRCEVITPKLNDINDCFMAGMTWEEMREEKK